MRLLMDLETNGLLDRPDLRILCGGAIDMETGEVWRARPEDIPAFAQLLMRADELVGHNIAGFDLPVLDRLVPGFHFDGAIFDTRCASRMGFHDMLGYSSAFRNAAGRSEEAREARYPKRLLAQNRLHSLEAWGYRLGERKDDYLREHGVQEEFSEELLEYCIQDLRTNLALYRRLTTGTGPRLYHIKSHREVHLPLPSVGSVYAESKFAYLMAKQELNGVGFDEEAAAKLYLELSAKRDELVAKLREFFPPWWGPEKSGKAPIEHADLASDCALEVRSGDAYYVVPRRSYKVPYPHRLAGREAGYPFTPIELIEFNPESNAHVANRLTKVYGWKPKEWTESGQPKLDETVLASLDYPCAPYLLEYNVVSKVIGQLAEGKQAWMKLSKGGKIHGRILTHGTRTSRCSHSNPNLGQVPSVGSPYGLECRSLFRPTRRGWRMVGADASSVELRMLGHRLAFYDGGNFSRLVTEGDPHVEWMLASGIFIRNNQKTCTYAFLYGAGDPKLGKIRLDDWRMAYTHRWGEDADGKKILVPCEPGEGIAIEAPPRATESLLRELGAATRAGLLAKVPGLAPLVGACKKAFRRGFVRGIDGRIIPCKSEHGVLNDVLQSDAGITMKYAMLELYNALEFEGLVLGRDYAPMLNVHDEWQIESPPEYSELIGKLSVESIKRAGELLGVRCPLSGDYKVGDTWADTH